jgi:hypothetical protein
MIVRMMMMRMGRMRWMRMMSMTRRILTMEMMTYLPIEMMVRALWMMGGTGWMTTTWILMTH